MPEQTELNRVAQIGYEAYADHRDWKAYNGEPIPQWANVKDDVQSAWEEAALAIQTDAVS